MGPLEKVKNRVSIQDILAFCHTALSINIFIKIEHNDVIKGMRLLIYKMKVFFKEALLLTKSNKPKNKMI